MTICRGGLSRKEKKSVGLAADRSLFSGASLLIGVVNKEVGVKTQHRVDGLSHSLSASSPLLCSAGQRYVWTRYQANLSLRRDPSSPSASCCICSWCSALRFWWDSGWPPQVRKSVSFPSHSIMLPLPWPTPCSSVTCGAGLTKHRKKSS